MALRVEVDLPSTEDTAGGTPVRRKVLPQAPAKAPIPSKANPGVVTLKEGTSCDLLTRRGDGDNRLVPASSASAMTRSSDHQAAGDAFKPQLSAALAERGLWTRFHTRW